MWEESLIGQFLDLNIMADYKSIIILTGLVAHLFCWLKDGEMCFRLTFRLKLENYLMVMRGVLAVTMGG